MARILIGCEESQEVTRAMRALGHEAFSNDLKPCSGGLPEYHLQMDVLEAIDRGPWDLIGLHPVCKKMAVSGNRHYAAGKLKHSERVDAVEWTVRLWSLAVSSAKKVYLENPIGALNGDARLPKPQIIHPYYFGDPFTKTTCLWLHGLPKLYHNANANLFDEHVTHVGRGGHYNWTDSKTGKNKRQPLWIAQAKGFGGRASGDEYDTIRSKTFPGVAKAFAYQWSNLI